MARLGDHEHFTSSKEFSVCWIIKFASFVATDALASLPSGGKVSEGIDDRFDTGWTRLAHRQGFGSVRKLQMCKVFVTWGADFEGIEDDTVC